MPGTFWLTTQNNGQKSTWHFLKISLAVLEFVSERIYGNELQILKAIGFSSNIDFQPGTRFHSVIIAP
jgi:hypothetical protein